MIRDITALARKHGIGKIILFGSRARGTHTERSDIDIAVYGGDFDSFYWDIQERVHTLLTFDIIDGNKITAELKNEIERDGVVLYEKAG
ncbi:nucleotidyltransferase domain-containing protein [Megasphaera stantonii]|uniref:nucleotidyltransferase family protein n=1 Tax=Megasphaera stantonii TaxID=2144175 RepID=UPI002F26B429